MRQKLIVLWAVLVAALALGVGSAMADPTNSPNTQQFTTVCPGLAPFNATVVGAVGFGVVDGQRVIAIRQVAPTQGSLTIVECTATNPELGTQTVFLTFVERG